MPDNVALCHRKSQARTKQQTVYFICRQYFTIPGLGIKHQFYDSNHNVSVVQSMENCQVQIGDIQISGQIYSLVYLFSDEPVSDLYHNFADLGLKGKFLFGCLP